MPGSSYTTPRREAWAIAEKQAPNDPVKQQEIFERNFERLCRNQDRSNARKKAGLVSGPKLPKFYGGNYTPHSCSGFFHHNFLNQQ